MADNSKKNNSEALKNFTRRNTLYTMAGYAVPLSSTYIARYLELTTISYRIINFLFLSMVLLISFFLSVVYFKKNFTPKFNNILWFFHFTCWILLFVIWMYHIDEVRQIALYSAMITFIYLFSIGSIKSALVIMFFYQTIYISMAYIGIYHLGHHGSFKLELLYNYCFFFASLFLILTSVNLKKQKLKRKQAIATADKALKELERANFDLKKTYRNIRTLVDKISVLSEKVAIESSGITKSSDILASGAVSQVISIKEIADEMVQINKQTSENAKNAIQANNITILASKSSMNGVLQMKKMSNAINNINSSSKSISKIIKTIDDIAFQTNLLALNASVEAARAGKHGRGFAVVAQEVRRLASRSADAASITSELIEKSLDMVKEGIKTSEITVNALDDINNNISQATNLVEQITVSSSNQTNSISQVNSVMTDISDITEETASSAKQTNLAASNLSLTSAKISILLQKFNKEKRKKNKD